MNNSQFRKLLLDTSARQKNQSTYDKATSHNRDDTQNLILGSRAKSFVPMTPRSVYSSTNTNEFVRQLAERKNASSHSLKKSRSSAAPKGSKLPAGYIDRTKIRHEDSEISKKNGDVFPNNSDKMQSNNSMLPELQGKITSRITAEERAKIVKGLDWDLLEKVKKGEMDTSDLFETYLCGDNDSGRKDVETELEKLEAMEVKAISREKIKKKGEMAPSALTGKKRTRDQILAELKAARAAAIISGAPRLGSKFKKLGETRTKRKIISDGKGREVLIITDENGNEKRKVRKIPSDSKKNELLIPYKDMKPLGMAVPALPEVINCEEDMDIFDDVGDDYNPLAEIESENSSDDAGKEIGLNENSIESVEETLRDNDSNSPLKNTTQPLQFPSKQEPLNYFQTPLSNSSSQEANVSSKPLALSDPTILAALKKASKISLPFTKSGTDEVYTENLDEKISTLRAKQERHKRMLQRDDRDALDLDMGFGSSRVEDDNDADEMAIKLSDWEANKR